MLVYVWSRRHPLIRMNFFGLLNFQAPFLPWVLMGFSLLLGNSIVVDLLGIKHSSEYHNLYISNLQYQVIKYSGCRRPTLQFHITVLYLKRKTVSNTLKWSSKKTFLTYWSFKPDDEFLPSSGISVGHMYYFLEDVFPNRPGGRKLLMTPELL